MVGDRSVGRNLMTEKDFFGVVVRAFGLWSIVLGVSAIHGIVQIFGIRTMSYFDWQPAVAFATLYFIAGFALLRKASAVVAFAYPSAKPEISS
jgi:hypothetical protein